MEDVALDRKLLEEIIKIEKFRILAGNRKHGGIVNIHNLQLKF